MSKSPEMEKCTNDLAKRLFGRSRTESLNAGLCVTCGASAWPFRDEVSQLEYHISGMCQACQDSVFG